MKGCSSSTVRLWVLPSVKKYTRLRTWVLQLLIIAYVEPSSANHGLGDGNCEGDPRCDGSAVCIPTGLETLLRAARQHSEGTQIPSAKAKQQRLRPNVNWQVPNIVLGALVASRREMQETVGLQFLS